MSKWWCLSWSLKLEREGEEEGSKWRRGRGECSACPQSFPSPISKCKTVELGDQLEEEGSKWRRGRGEWRRRAWRISRLDWEMYERAQAPNFVMHCGTPCWPCCTFVDLAVLSWHSLGIVNTLQRAELTLLTQYMRKPGWAGAMYERAVLLQIIRNRFSTFYFVQHGRSRVGGAVR